MQEELNLQMDMTKEGMNEALEHLQRELIKVRTGKASPAIFEGMKAQFYGVATPINQMANITAADARTLVIQPWDKSALSEIERAIFEANMGVTPQNDGELIRINIPPLTEERRKDLAKKVKALGEDTKVSIRNVRRDMMDEIKKAVKDGYPEDAGKRLEDTTQDLTNNFSNQVDALVKAKEEDIMKV